MFRKVVVIFMFLGLFMSAPILVGLARGDLTKNNEVVIQIFNPYRFDVGSEVKCNWDSKKQGFKYYKKIIVPGKGNLIVSIGKQYDTCEIWPKVLW